MHCPFRLFRITRQSVRRLIDVARSAKRLVYRAWRGATWAWLVPPGESARLSPNRRQRLTSEVELFQEARCRSRELSSSTPASCPNCSRPRHPTKAPQNVASVEQKHLVAVRYIEVGRDAKYTGRNARGGCVVVGGQWFMACSALQFALAKRTTRHQALNVWVALTTR